MLTLYWPFDSFRIVGVALELLIAGIITVHVLLTKRDVRGALGWIAVAWLSPILGGLLYYTFGINRVERRAARFETLERERDAATGSAVVPVGPENIVALAAIGERVTGSPLVPGNVVSMLRGGDAAYPAMLAAIGAARKSVALASYIIRDDSTGRDFVDALAAAQARGVAVRVLLDGMGSGYVYSGILHRLHANGVPAARFLHTWLPWRMPFLNMRNHKKLLVVDGVQAFTGGMNIGADNSARLAGKARIDDVHLRIAGGVTRQLMDSFARDWFFTTGELLTGEQWFPPFQSNGPVMARGIRSGPDADIDTLEEIVGAALSLARERVRIVTPYFLPDQQIGFALAQAWLRGVAVDLVLPERSDYRFLDWAMRGHMQLSGIAPAAVHMTPPPFDHAKLMTVDGVWCLAGSSNWDSRSFRLNFEFDIECYDRVLTAAVDALIDDKIARSRELHPAELAKRPKRVQLRDAAMRLFLPYI